MLRPLRLLAGAALAAALVAPAVPAHAADVVPCEDGYIGVVVHDNNGELARFCIRSSDIPDVVGIAQGIVDPIVARVQDDITKYQQWVDDVKHMRCYETEGGIVCEVPTLPRP